MAPIQASNKNKRRFYHLLIPTLIVAFSLVYLNDVITQTHELMKATNVGVDYAQDRQAVALDMPPVTSVKKTDTTSSVNPLGDTIEATRGDEAIKAKDIKSEPALKDNHVTVAAGTTEAKSPTKSGSLETNTINTKDNCQIVYILGVEGGCLLLVTAPSNITNPYIVLLSHR